MAGNSFNDYGKTEPMGSFEDYGKTEPMGGFGASYGKYSGTETAPDGFNPSAAQKPTDFGGWGGPDDGTPPRPAAEDIPTRPAGRYAEPMWGETQTRSQDNSGEFQFEDIEPTGVIGPDDGPYGYMPVVGWLVCIEGNDRGRDYRLHAGYNSIGKNPGNDICITGDPAISRERHAMIAYDQEENLFFFAPGNGVNLLRLNNKVLMTPSPIKANDVLTIGRSKLIFIPLCSESFSWGKQA